MVSIKKYYLPGLISLLGLPLILLWLYPEDPVQYVVLKHHLPADREREGEANLFTKKVVYALVNTKKTTQYDLLKLQQGTVQKKIMQFYELHDTTAVLQITLNSENTYGDFVWVINQAVIDGYRRYAFADNSFYLFAQPPPVKTVSDMMIVPGWERSPGKKITDWDHFKWRIEYNVYVLKNGISFIRYIFKQNTVLLSAFMLLILLPALWRLSRNRKHCSIVPE